MSQIHLYVGYAVVGGWLLLFLWGCMLWLIRKDANRWYWGLLTILQILLGLQLLAGIVLLVAGGRPEWLHYVYGVVGPLVILVIAHLLTRGLEKPPYHTLFTIAAFIIFGLTARALMTGLGG